MKLFVSALLMAALPAAFAQNHRVPPQVNTEAAETQAPDALTQSELIEKAKAEAAEQVAPLFLPVCPLLMNAASVAAPAGYLPVDQSMPQEGTLTLHFQNLSGKRIRSASITAKVKVKTNIYALDAHPIALQLTFSGTDDVDLHISQVRQIALPGNYYLFGMAQVSLDRVTYADGTSWTASQHNYCRLNGQGSEQIAR